MKKMKTTFAAVVAASVLSAGAAVAAPGAAGHAHGNATAYGEPGNLKKPASLVQITMRETDDGKMLFFPDRLVVKRGEQIRFRLANNGAIDHEFVVATLEENKKHKAQMEKHPDMEHDDPNAARMVPKKTGEVLWRFTKSGEFEFACLIPGHYESGMKGTIIVK